MKTYNHVSLRCYVAPMTKTRSNVNGRCERIPCSSTAVLVLDTETTDNKYQNLLFGSCGIWINGKPQEFFIFYADDLSDNQVRIIKSFAQKNNFNALTRTEFVDNIFYPWVYRAGAKCIGFNLPFDLSRIAFYFARCRKAKNAF